MGAISDFGFKFQKAITSDRPGEEGALHLDLKMLSFAH